MKVEAVMKVIRIISLFELKDNQERFLSTFAAAEVSSLCCRVCNICHGYPNIFPVSSSHLQTGIKESSLIE